MDDRTGFPQRAERTRKQWDNLIVDQTVWEPRQPQDLVKGVKDQQSVVDARPISPAQFVGPLYYTLSGALTPGTSTVPLQSTARMSAGDPIGIVMDTDGGAIFRTTIQSVGPDSIVLEAAVPGYASSGNELVDYAPGSASGAHPFILDESLLDGGDLLA